MEDLLCLHVDLVGSREVTAALKPENRRRFSACCLRVLELLAQRFIEEQGVQIWWAGDGGICVVRKTEQPEAQILRLLDIAEAYPVYVSRLARPPIMSQTASWPLHFRRGVSFVTDVPEARLLDLRAIGSLELANALKAEPTHLLSRAVSIFDKIPTPE